MKNISTPLAIVLMTLGSFLHANAQSSGASNRTTLIPEIEFTKQEDPSSKAPTLIMLKDNSQVSAADASQWLKRVLGMHSTDELHSHSVFKDNAGCVHERFLQYHNGYPVEGGMYIAHSLNGKLLSANGLIYSDIAVQGAVVITEDQARNFAIKYTGAQKYYWENARAENLYKDLMNDPHFTFYPKGSLVITAAEGNYEKQDFRLAYKFDIYSEVPYGRNYVYVDAASGEIINTAEALFHGNATGTAATYYSGTQTIITDSTGPGAYRLRDYTRGSGGIETYNCQKTTGSTKLDFTDADNYWNNVNANRDEVATDAHWAAEMTYDYFKNPSTFNRDGWNKAGGKIQLLVHYGNKMNDANTNGTNGVINIGDGDTVLSVFGRSFTPWTSIETLAHEIFHNISQNEVSWGSNSGTNEPRAWAESISDIYGISVEKTAKPSGTYTNWIVGDEHNIQHTGIRSFSNPSAYCNPVSTSPLKCDTFPTAYKGKFWATSGTYAYRTNSSIGNYWFYLLTDGGSGQIGDTGAVFNVTGIGLSKSERIPYEAMVKYFVSSETYVQGRTHTIQAAIDLYGACSQEVISTIDAWYAVGVGSAKYAPIAAPTITPSGYVLTSSSATTYQWQIGGADIPGATSQAYTVTSNGAYTVVVSDEAGCTAASAIPVIFTSVGINEPVQAMAIRIYPNPSHHSLTVELDANINTDVTIKILDILGKELVSQTGKISGPYRNTINTAGLATGIYFLQINTGHENYITKILKE